MFVTQQDWVPLAVDTSVPSGARAYDYLLGGSHNFAVDREMAKKVELAVPGARHIARINRAFLTRAVRFMIGQGIRQPLDITEDADLSALSLSGIARKP